jgi:hypothetical protein
VVEIFWLGYELPEPEGTHLQELARSYTEEVIHKEWPLMAQGNQPPLEQEAGTTAGWDLIDDVRATIHGFEPQTKAEEHLYSEGLDQVGRLGDARRARLIGSEEGVPGILWAVLIFGGIAAVGFTYLFGLESTWAHRLMVVTLAAVIGLVLFTIGALEHPFSGGARIGPGFFELLLERFDTSKLSKLQQGPLQSLFAEVPGARLYHLRSKGIERYAVFSEGTFQQNCAGAFPGDYLRVCLPLRHAKSPKDSVESLTNALC